MLSEAANWPLQMQLNSVWRCANKIYWNKTKIYFKPNCSFTLTNQFFGVEFEELRWVYNSNPTSRFGVRRLHMISGWRCGSDLPESINVLCVFLRIQHCCNTHLMLLKQRNRVTARSRRLKCWRPSQRSFSFNSEASRLWWLSICFCFTQT